MAEPRTEADDIFDSASADELFEAGEEVAPPTQEVAPNSRGSFLDYLKAKFSGESAAPVNVDAMPGVRTTQTPTGSVRTDAYGRPVYSPAEAEEIGRAGGARLKERALEGGLSFLSGGGPMLDEGAGAVAAVKSFPDWVMGRSSMGETYDKARDSARSSVARATRNASPSVTVMGHEIPVLPVAGAVASSAGVGIPETLMGRLGLGAALGASGGFWNSEAETAGDLARDAAVGGGVGVLSAGVAEVPGAVARGGANLMQRGAARQAAKDMLSASDEAQSALGRAGAAGGAVQRGVEYVEAVLANPEAYDESQRMLAQRLAADPAIAEARKRVAENAMRSLRANIANQERTAAEASELMSNIPQRAQAATEEALSSPYSAALLPRAERMATRTALGMTGEAVGGVTGGIVSATPGAVQTFLNLTRDPRLQFAAGRDIQRAMSPLGNTARAAVTGTEAVTANRNAYQTLLERFGISAKSKEELADEAFLLGQADPGLQNGR